MEGVKNLIEKYKKEIREIEKDNNISFKDLKEDWLKGRLDIQEEKEMLNIFNLKRFVDDLNKLDS